MEQIHHFATNRFEQLVANRVYIDRKAGIQISDEQGTRDRSFLLTVTFRQDAIGQLLKQLGHPVWSGQRPAIRVVLTITDSQTTYRVTETSTRGWGQRAVIKNLSTRTAIPLYLPRDQAPLPAVPVRGTLTGSMRVTPKGYWSSHWRLAQGSSQQTWSVPANTFDRSIAAAVWKMAGFLANGQNATPN